MRNKSDIIAISDSQILRFIDELNCVNTDAKAKMLKNEIKRLRRMDVSQETKEHMKRLYKTLYETQFQEDYMCLIIDRDSDYDRANKGFSINGIK